jgi:acetylornithine deacetylase/succinyl-diaminopimelate desuccinylase family protein
MNNIDYESLGSWIDQHHAGQIEFLREIVRVPSDTPPGDNAPAAEKAAALLSARGHRVERHPVEPDFLAAYGMQSVTNLIVRHQFGNGGPVIALNAHGDVVPPGAGWTHPPYEGVIENGRMYARGVAVSKSDIATFTFALEALRDAAARGARLNGTIELHFTYDEEFGGLAGPAWLLEKKLSKPDYAIGPGFSYAVVTAHNGCLQLEVTVHGKAAHGAMPETGHDALQAAVAILNGLYAAAADYRSVTSKVQGITHPTLNVGLINGGVNTNVVPDKVVFKLDRRMIPEENPAEVEAALRKLISDLAAPHAGIRVDIRRLLLANALKPLPGHEKLVQALQRHGERVLGEAIPAVGMPLYTDARLYAEQGCPVVLYGAGPRSVLESNAKRADENLLLEDMRKATQVVAAVLADFLG